MIPWIKNEIRKPIWQFVFSYYAFATAFFMAVWVIEIRKGHAWWEYVCIAIVNCLMYGHSQIGGYEPPLKLFLWAQFVAAMIVAVIVSSPAILRSLH